MRKLNLGSPSGPNDIAWAQRAIKEIERASYEDAETIFDDYTVTGTFTATRTLDASTATLTDLIAVIATLITDIQKRGQHRTGG